MPNHSCVCPAALDRCDRCDLLLDFPGLHLLTVTKDRRGGRVLEVESCDPVTGCPGCGVVATGHGRVVVELIDAPWAGRAVRTRWRKRRWICREDVCAVTTFIEQNPDVCAPRALLTTRAVRWAIGQLRREGATIQGLARQLGTTWNTLWSQVQPLLIEAANDPVRFENVQVLGVDEHVWHHRDPRRRGPKELTGMVDLTRGPHPTARLLDLVPGRSGKAYRDWLDERGEAFRDGIEIATLDPFQGYKNAIDDQLEDATCVLDAFHIVKLAGAAVDDVRRRIQQETLGHRGRKGDPLYGIRHVLREVVESIPGDGLLTVVIDDAERLKQKPLEMALSMIGRSAVFCVGIDAEAVTSQFSGPYVEAKKAHSGILLSPEVSIIGTQTFGTQVPKFLLGKTGPGGGILYRDGNWIPTRVPDVKQ